VCLFTARETYPRGRLFKRPLGLLPDALLDTPPTP
jgi:hypothetical protein